MITVEKYPPTLAPARNQLPVALATDNAFVSNGSKGGLVIAIDQKPTSGQTLIFTYSGTVVELTARSFPSSNGLEFPRDTDPAGGTIAQYRQTLVTWLNKNYFLFRDFNITYISQTGWIQFEARNIGFQFSLQLSGTYVGQGAGTIVQVAGTDKTLRDNFSMLLQLSEKIGADYVPVNEEYLQVNAVQKAATDIGMILDRISQPLQFAAFPETAMHFNRSAFITAYKLLYTEYFGIPPRPQAVAESGPFYSFPGKVPERLMALLTEEMTDFCNYYITRMFFLHSGENTRKTDTSETQKLYWINAGTYASVSLITVVRYHDNTESQPTTLVTFSSGNMQAHELCTGYAACNIASVTPGKSVSNYLIYLKDVASGARISPIMTYDIDYRHYNRPRYFIFKNEYGVFDTFRFTGDAETNFSSTRQRISLALPIDFTTKHGKDYNQTLSQNKPIKVKSGLLDSKTELHRCLELIMSEEVYEIIGGKLYPVFIMTDSGDLYNDNNTRFEVEMQYIRPDETEMMPRTGNGGFSQGFSQGFNV